jgi:hypothetical protein
MSPVMKPLAQMTEHEKRQYFLFLAAEVFHTLPPGPSGRAKFALLVFDDGGPPQYVGNADRADVVRAFREAADRIEADNRTKVSGLIPGPVVPPPHVPRVANTACLWPIFGIPRPDCG